MRFLLTTFFIIIGLAACNRKTIIPEAYTLQTEAYNSIAGVDENLLSLDVYFFAEDESNLKPVVIWVHGGAWSIGDKANQLTNKLNLFEDQGYLLVSVNYRLSPNPVELDNPDRIKYPVHNEDVADAIAWVFENIESYGGDPTKLALLGHSAGAHLVALSGTSPQFLPERNLPLTTVCGVAAIDTEGYDVYSQREESFYQNAFGTDSATQVAASPITHLLESNAYPAFFIAKRGSTTRQGIADAFAARLEEVGADVTVIEGSEYDHAGINHAIGDPDDSIITPPLLTFLSGCFE